MSTQKSQLLTIKHSLPSTVPIKTSLASYEDNTYIDWMEEAVQPATGPLKKWSVMVLMAIAIGYLTVLLVLVSAGLNDFKKGICFSHLDRWSLLSPYLTCPSDDWHSWLRIISGASNSSTWLMAVIDMPIYVAFGCIFVLIAGYLTYTKAPLSKQSGIPEIKLIVAGLNYHTASYLGAKPLLVKVVGLVMVVASGLWLGKEGPLAHVACSILTAIFDRAYEAHSSEGLRRQLLCAATATGIAVAFNSPIGGVLFVLELIRSYFSPIKIMWNSFVAATITLVVVSGSKAFTEGNDYNEGSLFEVMFGNFSWLFTETIPFVILGLAGGFYGHFYTQMYLRFSNKHSKKRLWSVLASLSGVSEENARYLELLVVAVVTALATFPLSMSQMTLDAYLKLLFTECPSKEVNSMSQATNIMCHPSAAVTSIKLVYILIVGFFLSVYSYGLSLPGGILMPSLVLGGTLGRFVGIVSQAVQSKMNPEFLATCTSKSCIVSPSAYAVVGAAAFMTGITKLTVAVVVIIFELTGALTYVVPIMVAVMTSKIFNDWLCQYNIYDAWITNEFNTKEHPQLAEYNLGKGDGLCKFGPMTAEFKSSLPVLLVAKAMIPIRKTRHLVLFPKEPYYVSELYKYLSEDGHEGYPILASEEDCTYIGYIKKKKIYKLIMRSVGSLQPAVTKICFRTSVASNLAKTQEEFEEAIRRNVSPVSMIDLEVETATFQIHSKTSLKQVLELFERLHLNSQVITEYGNTQMACGFIDRFILARLIHERFQFLQYETEAEEDFENELADETLLHGFRRDRESIELLS